jgi:aarF domain-containing kinase
MSAEERRALRARFEGLGAQDVNLFLERLPRDMLFVMRTWALVRSLNRKLGGTTRQRFLTMGEHAATGAARHALSRRHGGWGVLLAALHERLALLKMRLLMRSYDLVLRLLLRWHGTRPYSSLEPG